MSAPLTPARRRAVIAGLVAALILSMVMGLCISPLGWSLALDLMSLRAGRVALAAIVGAGLAATGAALQALLRNPLADPYVLGVSGGAAMGGALALTVGAVGSVGLGLHLSAALGALLATALLAWFLAQDRGRSATRGETALLVGVTLNAFSWALVAVVRAALPAERTQILSVWLVGSVGYPEVQDLLLAAVVTALGIGALVVAAGDLSLLRAGEDEAARLGVDVRRARLLVYGGASALVGVAVSTSGVIGFIGLIAPHAVRLVLGRDDRLVVPAAALFGAAALVLFDAAARVSFSLFDSELPTGALTAVVGAPVFAFALWRKVGAARGGAR